MAAVIPEISSVNRNLKCIIKEEEGVDENNDGSLTKNQDKAKYEGEFILEDLDDDNSDSVIYTMKLSYMVLQDEELPTYDAKTNAFGYLPKRLYLQVPNCWATKICPLENVCADPKQYDLPIHTLASVYTLAKRQYWTKGEDSAVKWATLRMEAFKAGWFDNQEYTVRVDSPRDALTVFEADSEEIAKHSGRARKICSFVPFLTEFCFRTYGSAYLISNSSEFVRRAMKLARSSGLEEILDYLPSDALYGQALQWIEVKRPLLVLRNAEAGKYIPRVFLERAKWGPAGQAVVTSANAIIRSMETGKWWSEIKRIGGCDDTVLNEVAVSIIEDPWKYHMSSTLYGLEGLSEEETKRVKEAQDSAIKFAPILQAFCDTRSSELGKGIALRKYAKKNPAFYPRMSLFRKRLLWSDSSRWMRCLLLEYKNCWHWQRDDSRSQIFISNSFIVALFWDRELLVIHSMFAWAHFFLVLDVLGSFMEQEKK